MLPSSCVLLVRFVSGWRLAAAGAAGNSTPCVNQLPTVAKTASIGNRLKNPRAQRLMNWAAVLSWAGIIFYASSLSDLGLSTETNLAPILGHALEYAVLTFLLIRALGSKNSAARRTVWIAALLALAYAGSDEYHQSFVANRHPSALDLLVDAAAIGAVAILTVTREQA